MSNPDFTFNAKTGEIERGGLLIALPVLYARIFGLVMDGNGEPVTAPQILESLGVSLSIAGMHLEVGRLNRRLAKVALSIKGNNRGLRIVASEIPKWQPRIPEPVRLEGESR